VAEREIDPSPIVFDPPRRAPHEALCNPALPLAIGVPLRAYMNRYRGAGCTVVGRGVTMFDYRKLGVGIEPVFFINDAVCLERHVRPGVDTFFFAHGAKLMPWLSGDLPLRSVPVLPVDGRVFRSTTSGIWFCGFQRVDLIGRDCIMLETAPGPHANEAMSQPGGHDARLENRSNSWAAHEYQSIRQAQDLLVKLFGFEARYVGTPLGSNECSAPSWLD
jgi:hypothetical protein